MSDLGTVLEQTADVMEKLLKRGEHDAECPLLGDQEAAECPCGYASLRRHASSLVGQINHHIHGLAGM